MTRFLLQCDDGASSWWKSLERSNSLLTQDQQQTNLGRNFGSLAKSVQIAIQQYLLQQQEQQEASSTPTRTSSVQRGYEHIGLLFAMLPTEYQLCFATSFLQETTTSRVLCSVVVVRARRRRRRRRTQSVGRRFVAHCGGQSTPTHPLYQFDCVASTRIRVCPTTVGQWWWLHYLSSPQFVRSGH